MCNVFMTTTFFVFRKMGILSTCENLFGSKDLYQVLGVEKTASSGQIKKAYHKISLQVHPDRVGEEGREESTKKFQCVGAVYAILSDDERRGLYDDTGEVEDEMDPLQDKDKDWEEYWRFLFPKVTLDDIEKFEKEYRHSEEEKEDLKKAYVESEGDMGQIIDTIMCAREEDEERFRELINEMIKAKEVKKYKAFTKSNKAEKENRKRAAAAEAEEAEAAAKELGLGEGEDSLRAMILARQSNRGAAANSFLDGLAEKYGNKKTKAKKK